MRPLRGADFILRGLSRELTDPEAADEINSDVKDWIQTIVENNEDVISLSRIECAMKGTNMVAASSVAFEFPSWQSAKAFYQKFAKQLVSGDLDAPPYIVYMKTSTPEMDAEARRLGGAREGQQPAKPPEKRTVINVPPETIMQAVKAIEQAGAKVQSHTSRGAIEVYGPPGIVDRLVQRFNGKGLSMSAVAMSRKERYAASLAASNVAAAGDSDVIVRAIAWAKRAAGPHAKRAQIEGQLQNAWFNMSEVKKAFKTRQEFMQAALAKLPADASVSAAAESPVADEPAPPPNSRRAKYIRAKLAGTLGRPAAMAASPASGGLDRLKAFLKTSGINPTAADDMAYLLKRGGSSIGAAQHILNQYDVPHNFIQKAAAMLEKAVKPSASLAQMRDDGTGSVPAKHWFGKPGQPKPPVPPVPKKPDAAAGGVVSAATQTVSRQQYDAMIQGDSAWMKTVWPKLKKTMSINGAVVTGTPEQIAELKVKMQANPVEAQPQRPFKLGGDAVPKKCAHCGHPLN